MILTTSKRSWTWLCPIALIVPMFISCNDNSNIERPLKSLPGDDYLPLHSGNYWKIGTLPTRTADKLESIDNVLYHRIVSQFDTSYYRKTTDGKIYQRTKTSPEFLKFDLAANEGETWTYAADFRDYTWNATLVSKHETVTIGEYIFENCYKFSFDIPPVADDEHVIWLAPGVGFIEEYYSGGNGQNTLTEVKINGVTVEF